MDDQRASSVPLEVIDLVSLSMAASGSGPQWVHESADLDLTFLSWPASQGVVAHVNDEVDVLLIVMAGTADITIAARTYRLSSGQALLIPKGVERSIAGATERTTFSSRAAL